MATVIDLESPSSSPSPSPRSSRKRSLDGTLKGHQSISELSSEGKIESSTEGLTAEHSEEDTEPGTDSEGEAVPRDDIKNLLLASLDKVNFNSAGTFATTRVLFQTTNPGLYVEGLGGIGLPLSEHNAHRLITSYDEAHLASDNRIIHTYSQGSEKRMIELNPAQFELRNPAWQLELDKAFVSVATDLGIAAGAASIRAELCKLMLHEEGAGCEQYQKCVA